MKSHSKQHHTKGTKTSHRKPFIVFDEYVKEYFDKLRSIRRQNYKPVKSISEAKIDIKKILECKIIKVYFSEVDMRLWGGYATINWLGKRTYQNQYDTKFVTNGNYKFLNQLNNIGDQSELLRKYLSDGNDVKLLPYYLYSIFNPDFESTISSISSAISSEQFYSRIYGEGNILDEQLRNVLQMMNNKNQQHAFVDMFRESYRKSSLKINDKNIDTIFCFNLEEKIQVSGSSLRNNCKFKTVNTSLLVNGEKGLLFLKPNGGTKRTMIIFETENDAWPVLTFFLLQYYSSECRYKRSYLPLILLNTLGVIRIKKAYQSNKKYSTSIHWFTIEDRNNPVQNQYRDLMKELEMS